MDIELLTRQRHIYINGDINDELYADFQEQFFAVTQDDSFNEDLYKDYQIDPIYVFINSAGGELYTGLAIYDMLKKSKAPVITVCLGKAMSIASLIFLAGDQRLISEHSSILIHNLSITSVDQTTTGIMTLAKSMQQSQEEIDNIYLKNTNIPPEQLKKIIEQKEDWYINAETAIKLGIATAMY